MRAAAGCAWQPAGISSPVSRTSDCCSSAPRLCGRLPSLPRAGLPAYQGPQLVYDDSATKEALGISYSHTVASSLPAIVQQLRSLGQLDSSLL